MKSNFIAGTVVATLLSGAVFAGSQQSAYSSVQQELANIKSISGSFVQTRHIPLLSSPLISSGRFSIQHKTTLNWLQTKPFPSTLKLTSHTLTQQMGNTPPTVLTKESQPVVFSFANVFLSVFNGNTKLLANYFSVKFSGTTKAWTMNLTPKGAPLNKAIVSIALSGGRTIKQVRINEVKDSTLLIKFSNIRIVK